MLVHRASGRRRLNGITWYAVAAPGLRGYPYIATQKVFFVFGSGREMSSVAASISGPERRATPFFRAKVTASVIILVIAAVFVAEYVFRYYLHYNQAAFTDPVRGAPNYWVMRGWL